MKMTEKRETVEELTKAYFEMVSEEPRAKLDLLNKLTALMFREGKLTLAAQTVREELPKLEGVCCRELANVVSNMVKYTCLIGDYDSSIEYSVKAIDLYGELGLVDDVNDVIANTAAVYIYMERFEKSIEYNDKALEYARFKGDDPAVASFLNNKSIPLKRLGRYREAVECLEESIQLKRSLNKKEELCHSYDNLADTLLTMRRYDEALEAISNSRVIAKEIGDRFILVTLDKLLSRYHRDRSEFERAIELLTSFIDYCKETGRIADIKSAIRERAEMYEKLGDLRSAIEDYKELATIEESLYKESSSSRMAELESSFRLKQKMHEIELLSSKNRELEEARLVIEKQYTELDKVRKKLEKANAALKLRAERDPLTGCLNQQRMYPLLRIEIERTRRYRTPLSLIMIDLDDFKKVNDTHGHQTGDNVLRQVAITFRKSLRKVDYVFRYGGEEFLVLLPSTDLEEAVHTARRLKERVAAEVTPTVTLSAGVGLWEGEDVHNLIRKIDSRLYVAKANGKNRIEISDSGCNSTE